MSKWTVALALLIASIGTARAELPSACRPYASLPADAQDDILAWHQSLSLAACVTDSAIPSVRTADDLEPMVRELYRALVPAISVYLIALEHGPGDVQLRAAYHIGMAYVNVVVRARTATPAALRADLEPVLERPLHSARLVFAALVEAATTEPDLVTDPVTAHMIVDAKAILEILPEEPAADRVARGL